MSDLTLADQLVEAIDAYRALKQRDENSNPPTSGFQLDVERAERRHAARKLREAVADYFCNLQRDEA